MDGPIKRFRYWTQHILPLVYLDSLSYQELLEKVVAKLNEIVDWANGYEDDLKAYVDQKYNELLLEFRNELQAYKTETDGRMDKMQSQIDGIIAEVDAKIAGLESRVDAKIQANEAWVKAQIASLMAQVNAQLAALQYAIENNRQFNMIYTDAKIEELKRELPLFEQVIVRSPVNGREVGLQECLDTMFEVLRYWGLTCVEFDLIGCTCEEYDAKGLTAWEYDMWGRKAFEIMLPPHSTFSEVTGRRVPLQQAVSELWEEQRVNGLTAEAYDANNWTAQDYDNLSWTAYRYDWGEGNGPGPTPTDKNWELIYTEAIPGNANSRIISKDSNGNPFELDAVMIYVVGTPPAVTKTVNITLKAGDTTLSFMDGSMSSTTSQYRGRFRAYKNNNVWELDRTAKISNLNPYDTGITAIINIPPFFVDSTNQYVTSATFAFSRAAADTETTTVYIYGIRK